MALDMQDNVDPPDPPMTTERLREIQELSRCLEFIDKKKAFREMRAAVVELLDELVAVRVRVEAWERAAQEGHPSPCTLGPMCPYCEIESLRQQVRDLTEQVGRLESALTGAKR